jgi:hypothetical protein
MRSKAPIGSRSHSFEWLEFDDSALGPRSSGVGSVVRV